MKTPPPLEELENTPLGRPIPAQDVHGFWSETLVVLFSIFLVSVVLFICVYHRNKFRALTKRLFGPRHKHSRHSHKHYRPFNKIEASKSHPELRSATGFATEQNKDATLIKNHSQK